MMSDRVSVIEHVTDQIIEIPPPPAPAATGSPPPSPPPLAPAASTSCQDAEETSCRYYSVRACALAFNVDPKQLGV